MVTIEIAYEPYSGKPQLITEQSDATTIVIERILDLPDDHLDPHSLEQASQHFGDLKASNPALYEMLDAEIKELSRLVEEMANTIPEALVGGVQKYRCPECGKIHDRRVRAIDCRNSDLGVQPYVCRGICGKISWYVHHWVVTT